MAVERGRLAVGSPSSMSHGGLDQELLVEVHGSLLGVGSKELDLAHLLEDEDLAGTVAVDLDTWTPNNRMAKLESLETDVKQMAEGGAKGQ